MSALKALTQLAVAFADLLEAEGRNLRVSVARTAGVVGLMIVALLLAMCGVLACFFAAFIALSAVIHPAAALTILGLCLILFGGTLAWQASRMAR